MNTTIIKRITSLWKKDSLDEALKNKNVWGFYFDGKGGLYVVTFRKGYMLAWKMNWGYTIFKQGDRMEWDLAIRKKDFTEKLKRDLIKYGFKDIIPTEIKEEGLLALDINKETPLTEKGFWRVVEKMNWIEDNNHERINKAFKAWKYGDKKKQKALSDMFYKFRDTLTSLAMKDASKYNLGDDGLSDYIADIIGQGEKNYKLYIGNAKKLLEDSTWWATESFTYSFLD